MTTKAAHPGGRCRVPVVTEVVPAETFCAAEDYHQQYFEKSGRSACTPQLAARRREAPADPRVRQHDGWLIREQGPRDATHSVLLLPGALCSSVFYDDLLSEPALADASLRFVATTLPGFGGTTPPTDVSMENYARLAGRLAADVGCDVVVGHSLGANVALEMVAAGEFRGPVVLISPSLLARGRVQVSAGPRSPRGRVRASALCADDEAGRPGDEEQLAAEPARRPDRRPQEQRPALPATADACLSRVPRPPRLARRAALRRGCAGVGRVRQRRRHRAHRGRTTSARRLPARDLDDHRRHRSLRAQRQARADRRARARRRARA